MAKIMLNKKKALTILETISGTLKNSTQKEAMQAVIEFVKYQTIDDIDPGERRALLYSIRLGVLSGVEDNELIAEMEKRIWVIDLQVYKKLYEKSIKSWEMYNEGKQTGCEITKTLNKEGWQVAAKTKI